MSEHVSIERMNESLDGLLSTVDSVPMGRHIESCAACRNEYARLSETVAAVAALPKAATVPTKAWDVIASRIDADAGRGVDEEVPVYRLPTAAKHSRRISFSVPELAAAAMLVAVISASMVWVAIGGGDVTRTGPGAETRGGAAARAVSLESTRYSEVVDRLEQILAEGRSFLAPETLVTIEESLGTVDSAIAEIETALADDPNSALLLRMLANHQRMKLGVLQRAAAAVQAQT